MPARIAGIQVRKDASANIHVSLDSSIPCWNDAIEGALLEVIEVSLPPYFRKENTKFIVKNIPTLRGFRDLRGENVFRQLPDPC